MRMEKGRSIMAAMAVAALGMVGVSASMEGTRIDVRDDPKPSRRPERRVSNRITNPGDGAGAERQRIRLQEKAKANAEYYRNAVWPAESRQVRRRSERA